MMRTPIRLTGVAAATAAAVVWMGGAAGTAQAQIDPAALKNRTKQASVEDVVTAVNAEVVKMWNAAEVVPTTKASDAEWVRRVYLDLIGRIPTHKEAAAFLSDKSKDKKAKLVDTLLASEESAEHFATYFGNLVVGRLSVQNAAEIGVNKRAFEKWAKENFMNNVPWDQWVQQILTAKAIAPKPGDPESTSDNDGPQNFFTRVKGEPTEVAARASQLFLGVQIQCAQCHNHPFDEWRQADFWGMVGFFVRTKVVDDAPKPGKLYRSKKVIDSTENAEAQYYIKNDPRLPRQTQLPKFLKDDAQVINPNDFDTRGVDRRFEFARWVTSTSNPFFSKAAANRMWYYMLGRGIVNPVDDMGSSKRPVSVQLLTKLADDFRDNGYDLKRLIKVIALSEPYQLASTLPAGAKGKTPKPEHQTHFTHFYLKTMTPEQLFYSIVIATGGEDAKGGRDSDAYKEEKNTLLNEFTQLIDNDENKEVTRFEGSIPLALRMLNGDIVNKRVEAGAAGISYFSRFAKTDGDMINILYMSTLSRPPTANESANIQRILKGRSGPSRFEDVFWALLNSSEFIFIH